jgi:hypothetical protein
MPPPPCAEMGRQCRSLSVVLRVCCLEAGPDSGDHEATWLLGHTQSIRFGRLWREDDHLYVRATLQVPCRFLNDSSPRTSRCMAFGYSSPLGDRPRRLPQERKLGPDSFELVERGQLASRTLATPSASPRQLPLLTQANPCASAKCRTADNRVGAACCRDLQVEIMCYERNVMLDLLIRARKSPYLCKVTRSEPDALEAEMISACSYLISDGVSCGLHGRKRPDGRSAKPDLCFEWPTGAETTHPGCVFTTLPTHV